MLTGRIVIHIIYAGFTLNNHQSVYSTTDTFFSLYHIIVIKFSSSGSHLSKKNKNPRVAITNVNWKIR